MKQKVLTKRTFSNFMADKCKSCKLSKSYPPHCLRATAVQAMNDRGFSSRHIMFMSGYRCEASLKSYRPVPEQFDWHKIRTEMKPIKMARTKA